ncbi:MAG: phenylacetic acid degradation operon negative regulatory protein [Parcubacteria group bacterium Athens0714_24]|nr:MAG: phenylacetic acid degradation operon negative regulatory protein [Parcubacteria group bacterium Athens0714_24]
MAIKIKSETKQKILLLLLAGLALGMSKTPKRYFKVLKTIPKEWKDIKRRQLLDAVREFYNNRIVDYKELNDGTVEVVLTKEGRKRALIFKIDEMEIKKPDKWDGKWRIVIFDIPEKKRAARFALRNKLKDLGFKELQKSVFVHPYECEDEIDFIVEVFEIRPYVKFLRTDSFTNDEQFKLKFKIY